MQILHPNIVLANIRKQVFGNSMLPSRRIKISIGKKDNPIPDAIMDDNDFIKYMNKKVEKTQEYLFYSDNKAIAVLGTNYIPISNELYSKFESELKTAINKWNDSYSGDNDISWQIEITTEESKKNYYGNGGVPTNWDEFIKLVTTYDSILKDKKNNSTNVQKQF